MGLFYALTIIFLWLAHLGYCLQLDFPPLASPQLYLHMLIQAWLYTGLFITGHDAMHGTVSKNKTLNDSLGIIVILLFAGMNYQRLLLKHKLHHLFPAEERDPDYTTHSQNFWTWWFSFMRQYITLWQLIIMAVLFNVLLQFFSQKSLLVFWIIPAFLATLQLFYFGTFRPHRLPHLPEMEPHKSRSQSRNHIWAMLSCYFFGYHYEHHESPKTPWWQLWKIKIQ